MDEVSLWRSMWDWRDRLAPQQGLKVEATGSLETTRGVDEQFHDAVALIYSMRSFSLLHFTTDYGKYYRSLRDFLTSHLGDQIELIPKVDRGTTGNFEVTVVASGQLLHSKRTKGQGKATSMEERMVILDQIKEILEDE